MKNFYFKNNPISIQECKKPNMISHDLQSCSEMLTKCCKFLCYALIFIAVITTLGITYIAAHISSNIFLPLIACIVSIALWSLYTFIVFFVFRSLSLVIDALACMVYNTSVSANLALFTASMADTNQTSTANQNTDHDS